MSWLLLKFVITMFRYH